MKNLLIILITLISINCYSQDFERWTRYTYCEDYFNVSKNVKSYVLNPQNHSGMKFVFDIEISECEYDTYVYGKLFKEDDWTLIVRSDSSRIIFLDNFLYYRKFKLVSKTGVFIRIKTKLFYE